MKKKILLSSVAAIGIVANAQDLGTIDVTETINTKVVNDVSTNEVKNADLAEALDKKSPSISLIRRSGIANDILLRGQKRDNIKVTIDDAVVHGACPNRMDPPTSHVLTSNVDSVEIKEGPFDVTEFGTLSGGVKIKTKKPTKELSGEVTATVGSFGYKKGVLSASGGNDTAQVLVTYSKEDSEQYEDGDGKDFYEQLKDRAPTANQLADKYRDMDAYEKQSLMVKTNININEKSELELSLTQNESDNILYPNTSMDAIYDDSEIYNLNYNIRDLGKYSKKLEFRAYHSEVDHPMAVTYRNNVTMMKDMTNHLTTDVDGFKLLNTFDFMDREITVGADYSKRNWDGRYTNNDLTTNHKSIDDVDTKNKALFLECKRTIDKTDLEIGARYDNTDITNGKSVVTTDKDREFNSLSANVFATYNADDSLKYFIGLGRSYRVPDARELYSIDKAATKDSTGNDDLKQTKNDEIDLGVEKKFKEGKIKLTSFYSKLRDYIYLNSSNGTTDAFENIDATIYGAEFFGEYYLSDKFTFDLSIAYKRGKKDTLPTTDTDKDLADIAPLQTTIGLRYDHDNYTNASIELVSSQDWNKYDSDNGEQKIDGYNIVNIKGNTKLHDNLFLTVGIDNLFDQTYAVSNTYKDLTLLSDGTTGEVMLMNEPGRYIYTSLSYKF